MPKKSGATVRTMPKKSKTPVIGPLQPGQRRNEPDEEFSQWLSSWKLFDERQRSPKEIRLGCDSDGIGLLLMDDILVGDSLTAFMALFINLNYKLLFFLEPQDPVRKTRMRGADEDVGGGGGA